MSSFTSKLVVSYIDGKRWRVEVPFRYYLSDNMRGEYIDAPVGFITNFASIPRPFRRFVDPLDSRWAKIALIHDGLVNEFSQQLVVSSHPGVWRIPSWSESADIFENGCRILGCQKWIRNSMSFLIKFYGMIKGKQ